MPDQQGETRWLARGGPASIGTSPLALPPASSGRRPVRLQIRTGLAGPSSKTSIPAAWTIRPSRYSSVTELPMTRSGGIPYTSWLTGRRKSRPPPVAM